MPAEAGIPGRRTPPKQIARDGWPLSPRSSRLRVIHYSRGAAKSAEGKEGRAGMGWKQGIAPPFQGGVGVGCERSELLPYRP